MTTESGTKNKKIPSDLKKGHHPPQATFQIHFAALFKNTKNPIRE
jgi:hypothetical protein